MRMPAVLAASAVLVIAGCSDSTETSESDGSAKSGKSTPGSKFIKRMDGICEDRYVASIPYINRLNTLDERLSAAEPSSAESRALVIAEAKVTRAQLRVSLPSVEALRALTPPPSDKRFLTDYIRALEQSYRVLEKTARALESFNPVSLKAAGKERDAANARVQELATRRGGLFNCETP